MGRLQDPPTPISDEEDPFGGGSPTPTTEEKKTAIAPLFEALQRLGVVPVDSNQDSGIPYYLQDPGQYPEASAFADPQTGILYDNQAKSLPKWQSDQIYAQFGVDPNQGGSGGGGDGGLTAYQQATLGRQSEQEAYQRQQDAQQLQRQGQRDIVGDALDTLAAIRSQQQDYTARQAQSQNSFMDALGVSVAPGQEYFPGFGPQDIGAQLGLVSPQKINHQVFDPTAVMRNPYDPRMAEQLGVYQGLTAGV